jgi:hypothetical protein
LGMQARLQQAGFLHSGRVPSKGACSRRPRLHGAPGRQRPAICFGAGHVGLIEYIFVVFKKISCMRCNLQSLGYICRFAICNREGCLI